jgi:predicted nucleic acid-binding Zn ribbon protein
VSLDPIGEMLTPFLERLGLSRPDTAARLSSEWEELAGEPWATRARPAGLRNGQLVVDVIDAATVSLLRYRTGELLERLDEKLGEGTVEVIRLRVAKQPF